MRTTPRSALTLGLSLCLAAVLPGAPTGAEEPEVPDRAPCAKPVVEDPEHSASYRHRLDEPGLVEMSAPFDVTCRDAVYTFTVTSDRKKGQGLRELGWRTTAKNGVTLLPPEPVAGTSVAVSFTGDGLPRTFALAGEVSKRYYDEEAADGVQCVRITLTVRLPLGLSYTYPDPAREGSSDLVCTSGGATSYFR